MVSQNKLRKMRDAPQLVSEKNLDGSHHYPTMDDGSTGTALDFDEAKGAYLPPDTDALPEDSDPNITREHPSVDGDFALAALTGAAALEAAHQQKAAQEHHAEAVRNPNTPQAQFHYAQEQRHVSAQVAFEQQELAAREQSPTAAPAIVDPTPQNMDAPVTQTEAAHERLESLRREQPDLVAAVGDGAIEMAPAYEDYTERPMYSSEMAGGQPEEAPFGVPAMGSGPLAYGTQEGDHTSEYAGDIAEATSAHHEHLQSLGDANIAHQRFAKAQGKIGELRAKNAPTGLAEKQAGWAQQQEQRAYGLASQAQRIEDGERWVAREHLGADLAKQQQESGAHLKHKRHERAEESLDQVMAANEVIESAGREGRRDAPEQVRVAQGAPEAPVQAASRREDYFNQEPLREAAEALHATESGTPPPSTITGTPETPRQPQHDETQNPVRAAAPAQEKPRLGQRPPNGMQPAAFHTPVPAVPSAPVKKPQPQQQQQQHAEPQEQHEESAISPAVEERMVDDTPTGEAPSPIDMAERGVVQPAALPAYVTTESDGGTVSYVFKAPPEAVALGFEATTLLGVDDGTGTGGIGEQAWTMAAEMEAAIAQSRNASEITNDPDEGLDPEDLPADINSNMQSKPLAAEDQREDFRREQEEKIQHRRDEAIRREVKPENPWSKDDGSELGEPAKPALSEVALDNMLGPDSVEGQRKLFKHEEPETPAPEL